MDARLNDTVSVIVTDGFWAGTLAYSAERGRGVLYRLEPSGDVVAVLEHLSACRRYGLGVEQ